MYDKMSVISQKGESQNGCCKKWSTPNFPKKEMFIFMKIWRALFSWNIRFEIHPFALLPTKKSSDSTILPETFHRKWGSLKETRKLNSIEILKSLQCQGRSCWNSSKYINWIGKFSNYFCVKWFQRLTFNTWRFSDVFIGNFEENSHIVLVFP